MVPLSQDLFLQPAFDRLRVAVLEQNIPGSVEGLLAHHVLKEDPRICVDWQVLCTHEWASTQFQPTNLDHVAALGYSSWAQPAPLLRDRLLDGLARVRERDAFKGQHLSIARNPTRLLGIILGCLALGTDAVGNPSVVQGCARKNATEGNGRLRPTGGIPRLSRVR